MYGCRVLCEQLGASAIEPVRQSSSLAVTETDVLALCGMQPASVCPPPAMHSDGTFLFPKISTSDWC